MTIYRTNEWPLHSRQSYGWNEYRLKGDRIVRYRCSRRKVFDGHENNWIKSERIETSWVIGDPEMPEWLIKHIP